MYFVCFFLEVDKLILYLVQEHVTCDCVVTTDNVMGTCTKIGLLLELCTPMADIMQTALEASL